MTTRRRQLCDCGSDFYDRGFEADGGFESILLGDEQGAPAWRCCNCYAVTPRRVVQSRTDTTTPSQLAALEQVKLELATYHGRAGSKYPGEIKSCETELTEHGELRVVVESGKVGDEGNGLEMLRTHDQIWIGRSGGLSSLVSHYTRSGEHSVRRVTGRARLLVRKLRAADRNVREHFRTCRAKGGAA